MPPCMICASKVRGRSNSPTRPRRGLESFSAVVPALALPASAGLVTEKANALKGAKEALVELGITPQMIGIAIVAVAAFTVLAASGLAIWYVADRIEQRRIADYRSGKHP